MHVRLDRPHRALDDQSDADGGREMEDDVALIHQLGDCRRMMDALDRVMEPGMPAHVADILDAARGEVVEDEHLVAPLEIRMGQVQPDESRPAGDEHAHRSTSPEESPRRFKPRAVPPRRARQ